MNIIQSVEKLIAYAQSHLMLDDLDVTYVRNCILDELAVKDFITASELSNKELDAIDKLASIDSLIDPVVDYAVEKSIVKVKDKATFAYNIIHLLVRRPSELIKTYQEQKAINSKRALDWLSDYVQKCNFIVYPVLADCIEELAKLKLKVPKTIELSTQSCTIIEDLLGYADAHLFLDMYDIPFIRTRLIAELKVTEFDDHMVDFELIDELHVPDSVIEPIVSHAVVAKIIRIGDEKIFADKVMSLVSKRPSEIYDTFSALHKKNSSKAFEWAYDYAIKSDYVNYSAISNNRHWEAKNTRGKLEVTINTARKEKSDDEVIATASDKSSKYPQCEICQENEGVAGRKTLRVLPITLGKDEWFWQFSPFSYFNQHGSLINSEHTPMKVDKKAIVKMLEFTDFIPTYFMGCNASLPRVGGSILAHDHFQGGRSLMPMFKAPALKTLKSAEHPYMKIEMIDWYLPVLRLRYTNKEILANYADIVRIAWEKYSNAGLELIAKTGNEQHNCIAVAARKMQDGFYCVDLIFRNNATNKNFPEGIFAARGENRAIKSEAVGIIESLGHFILPARLEQELRMVEKYLTKEARYSSARFNEDNKIFIPMIERLLEDAGSGRMPAFEAALNVKQEVNRICEKILEDCAVFKPTDEGREQFTAFLKTAGIEIVL